jgi:hypothetical protein
MLGSSSVSSQEGFSFTSDDDDDNDDDDDDDDGYKRFVLN